MSLYLNAVVHNPKNMSATEIAEKVESVLEEFVSSLNKIDLNCVPASFTVSDNL